MGLKPSFNREKFFIMGLLVVLSALFFWGYLNRAHLFEKITSYYRLFADREKVKGFITSFGPGAPVVFIVIQILQVLFAPIPGEATGFIGGFLFGVTQGFLYSTFGLTVGSWINFVIGRLLGRRYVRKLVPEKQLDRFDRIIEREGMVVLFFLFLIPGFPKDYLCFFLGLSNLPLNVFMLITTVGRMPGTFMLSLQGAFLYEKMYGLLFYILGLCMVVLFFAYRYRENLYRWVERFHIK